MKKYLLCEDNKRCSCCGSSLQLTRKKTLWYYQRTQTSVERQTNIFHCKICRLDYVMQGYHVDDSGWERLELPITALSSVDIYRGGHNKRSSEVRTYIDPTLKKQANKPMTRKFEMNQSRQQGTASNRPKEQDPKKLKGIKRSYSEYRNCGNCDFYIKGMCRTHSLMTLSDEVCSRFKHYRKREVSGGAFSPR